MTTFDRRGFFRISKNGNRHWVSEATVSRYDWYRSADYSATHVAQRDQFLERFPEFSTYSWECYSACLVNPNANCPVCNERVFYYQNESGSRVYFDELGPPWPKHPCMDLVAGPIPRSVGPVNLAINPRAPNEVAEVVRWQERQGSDFAEVFRTTHGNRPWPLAVIEKRERSGKNLFLVLRPLMSDSGKRVYISCKSLPRCCVVGSCVAFSRGTLSFIDVASLESREVPITRYRGATPFLEANIKSGAASCCSPVSHGTSDSPRTAMVQ